MKKLFGETLATAMRRQELAPKECSKVNVDTTVQEKRRQAIEPIIGLMKSGHRMDRNFLRGKAGDAIKAILAECGFNMAKLVGAAALWFRFLLLGYVLDFSRDEKRLLAQTMLAV